jgi:hypothetical protein
MRDNQSSMKIIQESSAQRTIDNMLDWKKPYFMGVSGRNASRFQVDQFRRVHPRPDRSFLNVAYIGLVFVPIYNYVNGKWWCPPGGY